MEFPMIMLFFYLLVGCSLEAVESSSLRPQRAGGYNSVALKSQRLLGKLLESAAPVPEQLDWRQVPDRVSEVSNQGDACNAGYAFATAGLLEGQLVAQNLTQKLAKLSAQQLIDCSHMEGCRMGTVAFSLELVMELGGLESNAGYPYRGKVGQCAPDSGKYLILPKDARHLMSFDEVALKRALANYGPIAVSMDASTAAFKNYTGGVFADATCKQDAHYHDVLIVGYGNDPRQGDFWIAKNSWGTQWGERGYFRIKRGVNMCGIAEYPIVALF